MIKDQRYLKELLKRVFIVAFLVWMAYFLFIEVSRYDEDILTGNDTIAAILFIFVSVSALSFYYINLFNKKKIHRIEFIMSLISVFFLTITIFAIIYSHPNENPQNYFLEMNKKATLSFSDALYFSTTTITTLGSGIEPMGVFRLFVMAEVIIGMIYVGLMLYFLTKVIENR